MPPVGRFGRVRAMVGSILAYSIFSGCCYFARSPEQLGLWRFLAAVGMGGEWSLGVALINEIWPERSRAFLAGLIGAAGNVGYLLIALIGRGLTTYVQDLRDVLGNAGLSDSAIHYFIARADQKEQPWSE